MIDIVFMIIICYFSYFQFYRVIIWANFRNFGILSSRSHKPRELLLYNGRVQYSAGGSVLVSTIVKSLYLAQLRIS